MKEHLKQLIESVLEDILFEFKTNFKLNEFKKLESPQEIISYAKKNLPVLGEGTARIAFRYPNSGYVLKVAKSKAGVAQNKEEVKVFTTPNMKKIVADIAEFDDDYYWVVAEAVREFTNEEEFFKRTGINNKMPSGESLPLAKIMNGAYLLLKGKEEIPEVVRDFFEQNEDNEWMQNFLKAASVSPQMLTGDLDNIAHWGITSSGNVVLLDYGLTDAIFLDYYLGIEDEEFV